MICITGASGTVGSEVVRQLSDEKVAFRAAYHSTAKADEARARGIDAVLADFNDPDSLREALHGCDKLFLLGANVPNQVELETRAVEMAKAAGVTHVVKLSAIGAGEGDFALARIHREIEKAIETSGLKWTFLRPNGFMQNTATFQAASIKNMSAFHTATGDGRISFVDVRDIAAVAVKALTESGHEGKAYDITGPEALTYEDVAAVLSDVLGRKITHINLPPADLKAGMLAAGIPGWMAEHLLDLQRHYREGKAAAVTDEVKTITGRDPIRFADFARETAATGVW